MLLMLTLLYCGLVWLIFYKFKLLKFTTPRKVAVVAIGVAGLLYLVVALLIYMPSISGTAFVQQPVVEIRADVGGRVTQIWVRLDQDVKKGDPLFEVDPEPYGDRVEQAEAALRQAQQDVEQMKATRDAAIADIAYVEAEIEVLGASIEAAVSNIAAAKAGLRAQESAHVAAKADVENAAVDVRIGEQQYARIQALVETSAATESDLDSATQRIESAKASLKKAEALEVQARESIASAQAQVESTEAAERQTRRKQTSLEAQLAKAQAAERQARLQLESTIDGEHTLVRQARKSYEMAKWDLDHTTTYAPADGFVANAQLRVGAVVGVQDRVMTFVSAELQWVVTRLPQSAANYVAAGNDAEMTFKLHPGQIFRGRVRNVARATGESQPVVAGQLPAQSAMTPATTYFVVVDLDETPEGRPLRFGAGGTAAIYTENAKVFHIIRKVILRIEGWLNYLG